MLKISVREVIPGFRTIGTLFGKLYGALGTLGSQGLAAAVFHDEEFKENEVDLEVGSVRQLPAATAASIVHHGAFNRISEAYLAVLHWMDANLWHGDGAPPRSRGGWPACRTMIVI